MSNYAETGLVFFLFGIFCALWAQNTGRNAWLWFFTGWFFAPITGLVLLSNNSADRRQQQQALTHAPDNGSAPSQAADSVATAVIPREGGSVDLPGVVQVIFPAGAFTLPQRVAVRITDFPGTRRGQFEYWTVGGGPHPDSPAPPRALGSIEPLPLPYDVRISADLEPVTSFEVVLSVPDTYLATVPSSYTPRLLAEFESGGELELHNHYDVVPSDFDSVTKVIRAEVWEPGLKWARQDGRFEVILLIGSRPE